MTDFRKADISKQESYDLLRDWIKLVARHTNPDQDISELLGWLWKLKPATPDPITGLVPCGCGGKAKIWPSDPTQFTHVITDYEAGCTKCAMTTGWVRGKQENAMNVWNTAMGQKGGAK